MRGRPAGQVQPAAARSDVSGQVRTRRDRSRDEPAVRVTAREALPLMRPTYQVTELLGDGIGWELSRAVHRLAEALPVRLDFLAVDLRLENRRARGKVIYDEAVEA